MEKEKVMTYCACRMSPKGEKEMLSKVSTVRSNDRSEHERERDCQIIL